MGGLAVVTIERLQAFRREIGRRSEGCGSDGESAFVRFPLPAFAAGGASPDGCRIVVLAGEAITYQIEPLLELVLLVAIKPQGHASMQLFELSVAHRQEFPAAIAECQRAALPLNAFDQPSPFEQLQRGAVGYRAGRSQNLVAAGRLKVSNQLQQHVLIVGGADRAQRGVRRGLPDLIGFA